MKKLNERRKQWFRNRIKRQSHRRKNLTPRPARKRSEAHPVELLTAEGIEKAISVNAAVSPPSILCFDTATEETLGFLRQSRENRILTNEPNSRVRFNKYAWYLPERPSRRGGRALKRIRGYFDFGKINYLSTAAAVVLTAEFMRLAEVGSQVPPAINIHKWSDPVFSKLYEIGYFHTIGMTEEVEVQYLEKNEGTVRVLPIVTGRTAAELEAIAVKLQDLRAFLRGDDEGMSEEVELALNSALGEALINVSAHAYDDSYDFKYRHIGCWWVTAEANRELNTMTVVVYDQGATIPRTLPYRSTWDKISSAVARKVTGAEEFEFQYDGAYIEGAMRLNATRTGETNRGYGLPQMVEFVDICGAGSITVFSRGGVCRYDGKSYTTDSFQHSVGGTLVEWKIEIPRTQRV